MPTPPPPPAPVEGSGPGYAVGVTGADLEPAAGRTLTAGRLRWLLASQPDETPVVILPVDDGAGPPRPGVAVAAAVLGGRDAFAILAAAAPSGSLVGVTQAGAGSLEEARSSVRSAYRALGAALGYAPASPAVAAPAGAPAWEEQSARLEVAAALRRHLGELPGSLTVSVPDNLLEISLFAGGGDETQRVDTVLAISEPLGVPVTATPGDDAAHQLYLSLDGASWRGAAVRVSCVLDDPAAIARAVSASHSTPDHRVDAGLAGGAQ